jgi:hypothetical protein
MGILPGPPSVMHFGKTPNRFKIPSRNKSLRFERFIFFQTRRLP